MAQAATCVAKIYNGVIEDVINGVREHFLDDGIDEQVLTELKQSWEQKLQRMNVFDHSEPGTNNVSMPQQQQQQQQSQPPQQNPQGATASNVIATNLVPVQITVPAQQAGGVSKQITIHVPSSALANGVAGQQLQAILSSPDAAHTFSLEPSRAAEIIQRKLNQALEENGVTLPPQLLQYSHIATNQVDGTFDEEELGPTPKASARQKKTNQQFAGEMKWSEENQPTLTVNKGTLDKLVFERLKQTQVDGNYGTGDSSSEMSDDDDDDDDDKDDEEDKKSLDGEEEEDEDDGQEEEPLNSEDDVSEDENSDMFDTDNVVVCQYDKITRVRNKWKFVLKDGIMNLKGKDYVFQKSTGEGEW